MDEPTKVTAGGLDARSRVLRRMVVRTMEANRRGHRASAFSLVEIPRVLFDDILHYDPRNPGWEGRDRCILSKGHGCLALYVILAEKGFSPFIHCQYQQVHVARYIGSGLF